jgi:acyl dehydratase
MAERSAIMPLDPALVGHATPRELHTVVADDIRAFAEAIADPNPLFRETEVARQAGFAATLATPTFITRFRVPMAEFGLDPQRMQVLHGEQEYEYTRPLCAGDQVSVWQRLATLRQSSRGDGMAILALETLGETPGGESLFIGRATVIVREGAPAAVAAAAKSATPRAGSAPAGPPVGPLLKPITQARIDAYAEVSGDHNPIHVNPDAARAVGLDGTIAHGMLSMAFLGQLVTDWLAALPSSGGWLARLHVRFQAMVRPGDALTCHGVLIAGSEAGRQSLQLWAENQHGERVTSGDAEVAGVLA